MNLKIQYFKIPTEFEFARKFYLKGLKLENENLENKSNVKKSNLRDYDKEPLIIKDELSNAKFTSIIITIILLISCIIYLLIFDRNRIDRAVILIVLTYININNSLKNLESNSTIYFYENKIMKELENGLQKSILTNNIHRISKTMSSALPNFNLSPFITKLILFSGLVLLIVYLMAIVATGSLVLFIFVMAFAFGAVYLPQFIIHRKYGGLKDSFYDVIWFKDKDGKFFNFMVSSDKQYNEIKKYLLVKTGKSLDKVEKKFFLSVSWFDDK